MTELTKREQDRIIKRANTLDQGIKKCVRGVRQVWPQLACLCYEFQQERAWETLEHGSLEAYLADPDVEIERRTFFRLAQLHNELVLKREVDPERLGSMSVSRVQEVLPAITAGDVDVEQALADAEVTAVRDLREKPEYHGGSEQPIDPSKEPVNCPTCGSRVKAERLNGASAPDVVVAPDVCSCGHTPSRHARYRNPHEGEFWGPCRTCECAGLVNA